MAQFVKLEQAGGTWRLVHPVTGAALGRIWATAHIDRLVRDGDLAEAVAAADGLGVIARRAAVRSALQAWSTAGGHSVDLSQFTHSLNNDAGVPDGNRHLYLGGAAFGYLHGLHPLRDLRLARILRLAEELFAGENLGTAGARNAALDAALTRFRDDGGLAGDTDETG